MTAFARLYQEIYRPGTAISDASNLCTAVGGDQNKEFRGNAFEGKGPKGWKRKVNIAVVYTLRTY